MTLTNISILNAARHGGDQDIQGLFDYGPSLHRLGLQQTMEKLGGGRKRNYGEKQECFNGNSYKETICIMKDKQGAVSMYITMNIS